MIKRSRNEQGFTAVEGLLIVLVLAIIGFGGYYVWHNHHKAKPVAIVTPAKTTSPTPTPSPSTPVNPYAGWVTYTSKLEGISIKYPPSWTVVSNGDLFSILNNTSQEEDFSVQSPTETLSGQTVFAEIILNVATSGLTDGSCSGLTVYSTKEITVNGRGLNIVTLEGSTTPNNIIGMYVTDEPRLQPGSRTSTCEPSFASVKGNSNVFINASFSNPPTPDEHADGSATELTPTQYSQSSLVQQVLKSLESLSY